LLSSPSIEEACRRARINKTTVYEWLKNEDFRKELKSQRDTLIDRALDSLKANITKATETLVKHLDSGRENISIRAAESIIEFAQKALEHEELERGIEALEARATQRTGFPMKLQRQIKLLEEKLEGARGSRECNNQSSLRIESVTPTIRGGPFMTEEIDRLRAEYR
jgi:hypothetical protein